MRKIILTLGFGILGLWTIFALYWGMSSLNNPKAGMGLTMQVAQVALHPYFIPGTILYFTVMMLAAFSPLISGVMKNSEKKKRLKLIGQKTMAKIISIQNTGIRVNSNPYVKITVEIKSGVYAVIETTISLFNVPQVGNTIEVLYNPSNPTEAVLA